MPFCLFAEFSLSVTISFTFISIFFVDIMSTVIEDEEKKVTQDTEETQEAQVTEDNKDTKKTQDTKPIRMWETPTDPLTGDTMIQFTLAQLSQVVQEACEKAVTEHTSTLQAQFDYLRRQNAEFAKGLTSALQQIENIRAAMAIGTESVTYTRPISTNTIQSSPFDINEQMYLNRHSVRHRYGSHW